jgi:hypothetical protein
MARWVGSSSLSPGLSIAGSSGAVWSKLHTGRMKPSPPKNSSIWIRRTYISSPYLKVGDFCVPKQNPNVPLFAWVVARRRSPSTELRNPERASSSRKPMWEEFRD